jgi:hypothetical protein
MSAPLHPMPEQLIPLSLKSVRAQQRLTVLYRLLVEALREEQDAARVRADLERQIRDRVFLLANYDQRECLVRDLVRDQRAGEPNPF